MSRTIKFRAWDTKLKKWNLSVEIDCFGNIQEYKYNGSAFYQKYKSDYECSIDLENGNERFILVQFTGLLDCEGKEIWEGDVLEYTQHHFNTELINIKKKVVKWNYDRWNIYETAAGETDVKVIGNLYEHPNLLNNES